MSDQLSKAEAGATTYFSTTLLVIHDLLYRFAGIGGGTTGGFINHLIQVSSSRFHGPDSSCHLTEWCYKPDYSQISGGDSFTSIMSEPDIPLAIICGNDVLAAGAIVRARQQNIEIPRQVSITGFDDIGLATVVYPSLTTVRVPQEEMGKSAARLLLERLSRDGTRRSVEFETDVVFRESLGPPLLR